MKKHTIVYIDDEIHQHIAFESILPDEYEVFSFDSPLEAIEQIKDLDPSIVISDQRMPQMPGFKLLELVKKIAPNSIRIITTGYNDEESIVETIRAAQVFDYIVKPWDTEKLIASIERAKIFYNSEKERLSLTNELNTKNQTLSKICRELEIEITSRRELEKELKCWAHPFVIWAANNDIEFPLKRNLAALVLDIIDSSKLHNLKIEDIPARVHILQTAWEIILRHGGEVESQEGDKIYANFGLLNHPANPSRAAYSAAKELRSSLQGITDHYGCEIECGMAVHLANNCNVFLREAALRTKHGIQIRKKFDTSSSDIDLAHRLEGLAHYLPGSNILITEAVYKNIPNIPEKNITYLGEYFLKGQLSSSNVYILKSNKVSNDDISDLKKSIKKFHCTKGKAS